MDKEKVNILIVDDMPQKLLALTAVLEVLNENIVQAHSGHEALKRLLEMEFAVILLDVNMPDMDGFETAALIRQHRRCANTPIIFITAFAEELFVTRGYALGAVDYILSPVVPDILRTKVGVFVDLYRKTEQIRRMAEERIALAQEQAARSAAEEANRRKDEFLAVLSHELRNPLGPIRNAVHILQLSKPNDPEVRKIGEVLDRQVSLLARMVDDLLDVFRIAHRKISIRRDSIDLVELVGLTAEDHRSSMQNANLGLVLDLPSEPVWIVGDRIRLTQVLNNLLHNAFKFSEGRGQVEITMSADREKQTVRLDVCDSGIGIAPELLPHIFETFNQADRSLDRKQGGLGLGLALVKGLIELHGGRVHAASAGLGLGSRLGFELPLGKAPASNGKAHGASGQKGKQLRILVVEDNLDAARTLSLLLERFGHQVKLAHAGDEGVEAAKNWLPEVILCDLGLPGMDGYEVARILRADPSTASIQLIALSGYGYDEDRQRSRAAGFNLHLTKPADPDELKNLLSVLKVEAQKNQGVDLGMPSISAP